MKHDEEHHVLRPVLPEAVPRRGIVAESESRTDEEIAALVAAGETHLYERLVRRYERPLLATLRRLLGSRETAEEIAQEAFVRAYLAIDRFDPSFRFSTWLFRIAVNAAIDQRRRRRLRLVSLDAPAGRDDDPDGGPPLSDRVAGTSPRPDAALLREDERRVLAAAVERLPEDYRTIVLLRHSAGLVYEEIAEVLDLPLGTVKNRLHRARRCLKEILESGMPEREPAEVAPDSFLAWGPED